MERRVAAALPTMVRCLASRRDRKAPARVPCKRVLMQTLSGKDWNRIESFVGFGSPTAPFVFLGMEEGLLSEATLHDDLVARSVYEPYMDLYDAQSKLAGTKKYFGADPKNQWTWRPMCDLMLRLTEGVVEPTLRERVCYQADKLGRKNGLTLLAELMPYPRKRADKTLGPYKEYERFDDYQDYRASMLQKRLPLLQSLFEMPRPRKLVVAYGKGDWDEFKKLFETNWTTTPPFEWGRWCPSRGSYSTSFGQNLHAPSRSEPPCEYSPKGACSPVKDCSVLVERWTTIVNRVHDEMVDLLWQREQIRRVGKMIQENGDLLLSDKPFLWDVRRWYMFYAAMAVRRQTDRKPNMASLARLLTEIRDHPQCITRQLLVNQFREVYNVNLDSEFELQIVDANWSRWAAADGSLNVTRVQNDLDALLGISQDLMVFASSLIAHTSLTAIDRGTKLTFNDMDAAIDLFERLTIDYQSLLTGAGSITLLPTEQFDWYQQFSFAWKPQYES